MNLVNYIKETYLFLYLLLIKKIIIVYIHVLQQALAYVYIVKWSKLFHTASPYVRMCMSVSVCVSLCVCVLRILTIYSLWMFKYRHISLTVVIAMHVSPVHSCMMPHWHFVSAAQEPSNLQFWACLEPQKICASWCYCEWVLLDSRGALDGPWLSLEEQDPATNAMSSSHSLP